MGKIRITDNEKEMVAIGRQLYLDNPKIYTERLKNMIYNEIKRFCGDSVDEELDSLFYHSIYDYWTSGASINEFFFLGFKNKRYEEKQTYLTQRVRLPYVYHLNDKKRWNLLENKYCAYEFLKEFYLRDVISISSDDDYGKFKDFVSKHCSFVVKPSGLGLGIGVRKKTIEKGEDVRAVFEELLSEGQGYKTGYSHWKHANVGSDIVLEELIDEDERINIVHPFSVNPLRITTVRTKDDVHLFYPWIKFGNNKAFTTNAFSGAISCGINSESGVIETDGITELCEIYTKHPFSGVHLKGYVIPRWDELVEMIKIASKKLPDIRYVGWDVCLSKKGWCIVEGNFMGEFIDQMIYHRGSRYELEELIDWKMDKDFWWEYTI